MAEAHREEPNNATSPLNNDNADTTIHQRQRNGTTSDPDAQDMVIASLRSQIQDLYSQVTQLNNKLVKSYDRVSDLEDDLHVASHTVRSSTLKISQLEMERTQHLSALDTGLLVEKSHVTTELTRLMEKATEEAAQRGQAETARADIEKDLDDLSATLFHQANTMVAEARYARALSERKVEEAEQALRGAEEVVGIMQQQMQTLQAEKERAEKDAQEMQMLMGKGKWVERPNGSISQSIRLLSSHVPYQEYLLFIAHLRSVHPTSLQPPAMTTLLPLSFIARLLTEDSEPTVRLDLAPSLNWLSRRSVLSAIHTGQLTIEPVSSSTLLNDSSSYSTSTNMPGLNSSGNNISCALCGTPVFATPEVINQRTRPPSHPISNNHSYTGSSSSWSTAIFKKPLSMPGSANNSPPPTPPRSKTRTTAAPLVQPLPAQVYIFRIASPAAAVTSSFPASSLPLSSSTMSSHQVQHLHDRPNTSLSNPNNAQSTTIYPLCSNGWCLARLRTTCTLWAFVRTGIVEKVWEEEVPAPPQTITPSAVNGEKPPVPPRRRGIWGMASALGERAASWGGDGDKDKAKKTQAPRTPSQPQPDSSKTLPPPPPTHPAIAAHNPSPAVTPPPLPRRSQGRSRPLQPVVGPTSNGDNPDNNTLTPSPAPPPLPAREPSTAAVVHPQTHPSPADPPRSPANIPLPESRPTTPASPHPPTRATSPALGGAPPPPLPRRAAARVPRPLPGSSDAGSRPGTPAPPAVPVAGVEPAAGEGEVKEKEKEQERDVATTVPSEETARPGADITHPPREEKPREGQDVKGVESTHPAVESPVAVTPDTAKEEPIKVEETLPDIPRSSSLTSDDVFVDAETGKDIDGSANKLLGAEKVVSVDEDKIAAVIGKEAMAIGKGKVEEVDSGVYVGDVTWEERAWKELVRLREEMYWARVGGLR